MKKVAAFKKASQTPRGIPSAGLSVGYVPLIDAAPLIIASEYGLFSDLGLNVSLTRELGWASVRDKVSSGELHAAHMLAGVIFASRLGVNCSKTPVLSGLVMNSHGNAITISNRLFNSGVTDAKSLRSRISLDRRVRKYTFGTVSAFSSHHFLLRQWLESGEIDPDKDVRIVVLPPPLMVSNLREGNIDGFCVGEPWNSIAQQEGEGVVVETSSSLAPGHPEKVLMVREDFSTQHYEEHLKLIQATLEGCKVCTDVSNASDIARILSKPQYLNFDAAQLEASLAGELSIGKKPALRIPQFHAFFGDKVNKPSAEKARWVWKHIDQTLLFPCLSEDELEQEINAGFREDLYELAVGEKKSLDGSLLVSSELV